MATLEPFRGLRYDPAQVGDLARVVAPPYDVIDPVQRDALYARSPHNAVRLILNRDADPYAGAAATFGEWRRGGILAPDPTPSLYLYALRFTLPDGGARERLGVIGALRLESFQSGRVRPHERTLEKAKRDRLALVRACRASLSPIFGLVAAPGLGELVPARTPEIDVSDETGARHRVWRLADPAALTAIAARLAPHDVFIADGHHRYETALRYRDETRADLGASAPPAGAAPYDYVLAYLTTLEDPGLVILPTHRMVRTLPMTAAALRTALAARFRIEALPWTAEGMSTLLARLEAARRAGTAEVRIGAAVAGAGTLWLLTAPVVGLPFPADLAPELRALDVSALHQVVLAGILGLPIGERGGTPGLTYTQDARAAFAEVDGGRAASAFFVPSTGVDALRTIALAGLTMPEKSTFFHPKLLTGLVIYALDAPSADGAARGRTP